MRPKTQGGGGAKGAKARRQNTRKAFVLRAHEGGRLVRQQVERLILAGNPDARHATMVADLAVKAASENTSIHDASIDVEADVGLHQAYEDLKRLDLASVEIAVNDQLWGLRGCLPPRIDLAIDLTYVPYHGGAFESPDELKRCKAKNGTTWFHVYGTAYAVVRNHRVTLACRYVRKDETPTAALLALLDGVQQRGLKVRLVVADKGFCSRDAIQGLRDRDLPFIIPLPARGKRAKDLAHGRRSYTATYELAGLQVDVALVIKRNLGKYHGTKPGNQYFPYLYGGFHANPKRVDKLYRRRGGIESSYKLANQARCRTSTRRPAVRLLYYAVALIIQNVWVDLAWKLSPPQRGRGGRTRPPGFFTQQQFVRLGRADFIHRFGQRQEVTQLLEAPS